MLAKLTSNLKLFMNDLSRRVERKKLFFYLLHEETGGHNLKKVCGNQFGKWVTTIPVSTGSRAECKQSVFPQVKKGGNVKSWCCTKINIFCSVNTKISNVLFHTKLITPCACIDSKTLCNHLMPSSSCVYKAKRETDKFSLSQKLDAFNYLRNW